MTRTGIKRISLVLSEGYDDGPHGLYLKGRQWPCDIFKSAPSKCITFYYINEHFTLIIIHLHDSICLRLPINEADKCNAAHRPTQTASKACAPG